MCSIMGYCGSCADLSLFRSCFDQTISRGPDDSRVLEIGGGLLAFHRLAIMGLAPEGMQPFTLDSSAVVCNGEIYGYRQTERAAVRRNIPSRAVPIAKMLLPLYREYGVDMFRHAGRGIRADPLRRRVRISSSPPGIPSASAPCFMATTLSGVIVFASETEEPRGSVRKDPALPAGTAIIRTESSSVIAEILPRLPPIAGIIWIPSAGKFGKSSLLA